MSVLGDAPTLIKRRRAKHMAKTGEVVMLVTLAVFGLFGVAIIGMLINGWTLTILWEWFIVPFGLPQLSLVQAVGIAMVVGYLTYHYQEEPKDKAEPMERVGRSLGFTVARPIFVLGFGWLIHLFM